VVVCERDLPPGSWKDVLEQVTILSDPPSLIVTSRLADERLWAEALNLGAYDVLAKPLTERKRCGSLVQRGEHGAGRCGSQRGKNAINVKSLPLAERHEAAHSLGSWHSEILQTATLSARFEVGA
jgi:DNA-binding response OmpR family regulator